MTPTFDRERDLEIERVIRAPRSRIWAAWTDPSLFARWWVPAPALCRVRQMQLEPGGAFETEISEDGKPFGPHISGCFLAVEPQARIVFTTALVAGWRPADNPFITAVISLADDPEGTHYAAHVMHRNGADRDMHDSAGFADGWGTVIGQLAAMVEGRG
jgi:uncharacterized protein YndB with AHSA1/START domain